MKSQSSKTEKVMNLCKNQTASPRPRLLSGVCKSKHIFSKFRQKKTMHALNIQNSVRHRKQADLDSCEILLNMTYKVKPQALFKKGPNEDDDMDYHNSSFSSEFGGMEINLNQN